VTRFPAVPYVAPFCLFLALLAVGAVWPLAGAADQLARIAILAFGLWWWSRGVVDFRVQHWIGTVALGVLIFVLWIAPDIAFPGYRQLPPFHNAIMGAVHSSLSESDRHDPAVLFLRTARASIIVPIVEELFWRGWLMRWLIHPNFQKVPLGAYQASSFWMVAILFASEHGPYWDVGLVSGILFNLWMVRTKSLGDLIAAHAVANLCLSGYVIAAGKWDYWL
jgi:CAAX prenyl protease-like protein